MDLHDAADAADAAQVAALAVGDVDVLRDGRTPLWRAVFAGKADNAQVLVAAGADPHRLMMSGWSPARLAAAGSTPDLFGPPPELSDDEARIVVNARRLTAVLGTPRSEGLGLLCVAGLDAASAIRRLGAVETHCQEYDDEVIGLTDVPGGLVIQQPWGYRPQQPDLHRELSRGTVCHGLYENPKSGAQGSISRDGEIIAWDTFPGGDPLEDEPADQILLAYVHRYDPVAYSCAYTGLHLTDQRAITGEPDVWVQLVN